MGPGAPSLPTRPERGGAAVLATAQRSPPSSATAGCLSGSACASWSTSQDGRRARIRSTGATRPSGGDRRFARHPRVRRARSRARGGALRRRRGSSPFLFAIVGTGASACLVVDGRPYAGGRGDASCSVRHRSRRSRAALRSPARPGSIAPKRFWRIRRMRRSSMMPHRPGRGARRARQRARPVAGRPRGRPRRAARLPRRVEPVCQALLAYPRSPRFPSSAPARPGRWCGRSGSVALGNGD